MGIYTGSDKTPRGWILADVRVSPENEATNTTGGSNPRPGGTATPGSVYAAGAIEVSGDQTDSLTIDITRGGFPMLAGARYSVRITGEAEALSRGWQPPNFISRVDPIAYAATVYGPPAAAVLRNGTIAIAYVETTVGTLLLYEYNPETGVFTSRTPPTTTAPGGGPVALAVDDVGRLVIQLNASITFRASEPDTVAPAAWIQIGGQASTVALGSTYRARLGLTQNGDWCAFIIRPTSPSGTIRQFASTDGAFSFQQVSSTVNVTANVSDAIILPSGKIGLVQVTSGNVATWYASAAAWSSAASAVGVTIASNVADAWVTYDPVGRIYVFLRPSTAGLTDQIVPWFSDDDGATWQQFRHSLTGFFGDANERITGGQIVWSGASAYLVAQAIDSAGTGDSSVVVYRLGDQSNVCVRGALDANQNDRWSLGTGAYFAGAGAGFAAGNWFPVSAPENLACWSASGAGTGAINAAGRLVVTTAANDRYYTGLNTLGINNDYAFVFAEYAVTTGSSAVSRGAVMSVTLADGGGVASGLEVRASTTGFSVYQTSGSFATFVSASMTTPMQFLILMRRHGEGEVYYRRRDAINWTLAYSVAALTQFAAASNVILFGCPTAQTYVSEWSHIAWKIADSLTVGATSDGWGSTLPFWASKASTLPASAGVSRIIGRQLTGLPAALSDRSTANLLQTYVVGRDGPFSLGEAYSAPVADDYPWSNVYPQVQPSPRRKWKSETSFFGDSIVWTFNGSEPFSLTRHFGVAVFGAKFKTASIYGYDAASTPYLLGTVDLSAGLTSLRWTRAGSAIRVDMSAATPTTRYIFANTLRNGHFCDNAGRVARIESHTEGIWANSAGKHVELRLADSDQAIWSAMAASGINGEIWSPSGFAMIYNPASISTFYKLEIVIPPFAGLDVAELGTLVIGRAVVPGRAYDWGGSETYERNAIDSDSGDGVSYARRLGPTSRVWSWAWTEGVDQSRLLDASPAPDFLSPDGNATQGIASRNDAPYLIAGLLDEARSAEIPVVACGYMPSATSVTVNDSRLFMLCRLVSSVGVEHIQGDPETDAVYRVSPVTMREIV